MPQFSKKRGRGSPPKMLQHASGQARVVLDGKTIYLGKFDTPDAYRNYAAAIEAWQAGNAPGCVRTRCSGDPSKSVADVVLLFDQWIDQQRKYMKDGRPTTQRGLVRVALREFNQIAGQINVAQLDRSVFTQYRDSLTRRPDLTPHGATASGSSARSTPIPRRSRCAP